MIRSIGTPARDALYRARGAAGQVVDKSAEIGEISARRRFLEVVAAEVGDVDITKEDVLVSVGRGIEDQDNIEIAEELAELLEGSEPDRSILLLHSPPHETKLDRAALDGLNIEDISRATLPKDFERNPRIHNCWRITRPA